MPELPDDLYNQMIQLTNLGQTLEAAGKNDQALEVYEAALTLLPEPKSDWDATFWLMATMGDLHFLERRYPKAWELLMTAMREFDEARVNAFVCMRLGQTMLELGEETSAANWLTQALMLEGKELFDDEDPKYLGFVLPLLKPPPGSW